MRFLQVLLFTGFALTSMASEKMMVFIGTYTGGSSKGIYSYEFDPANGTLKEVGLAAETTSPSFLAIHPNKQFLYAVGEIDNFRGAKSGAVTAFRIDPTTGRLTQLNDEASGGGWPCHVVVDQAGKTVLAANYGGGSVCALPIRESGELGQATAFVQHEGSSVNPQRQKEPHAHSINLDAANRFAFVADLGLDKVMIYRFDPAKGTLVPHDPPFAQVAPGGGPRHLAFSPDGKRAYVNLELTSKVTAFNYDSERGILSETQTLSTLPEGWNGNNSTAEIQVHPTGKFVYCSNRGHDSVAVFQVGSDGALKLVQNESTRGKNPRHFAIDPTGRYLIAANQDSDSLVVYRIDPNTGKLELLGEPVKAPRPVCVKFLVRD